MSCIHFNMFKHFNKHTLIFLWQAKHILNSFWSTCIFLYICIPLIKLQQHIAHFISQPPKNPFPMSSPPRNPFRQILWAKRLRWQACNLNISGWEHWKPPQKKLNKIKWGGGRQFLTLSSVKIKKQGNPARTHVAKTRVMWHCYREDCRPMEKKSPTGYLPSCVI